MRKIRRPNVRIVDFPIHNQFSRSDDVLDTSIAGSYVYVEDRSNDGAGYKTGMIVGVVGKTYLQWSLEKWSYREY